MASDLHLIVRHPNYVTFKNQLIVSRIGIKIQNCMDFINLDTEFQSFYFLLVFVSIAVHLVDIWNVIEAFRENGLNTMEPQSDVSVARLETLVSSLYHNLNKRLTTAQQVDSKASLLLNWLIAAYSHDNTGRMRVFSIKVALATMCAGKLVDKMRCKQIFFSKFFN